MSDGHKYKIVVTGTLMPELDAKHALDAFCDLLQVSTDEAREFFKGEPRVLREDLSQMGAKIYMNALQKIGLKAELLRQQDSVASETPAPEEPVEQVQERQTAGHAHPVALSVTAAAILIGAVLWQLLGIGAG